MRPKPMPPCGTNAMYFRHRRRGETPCEACQRAHYEQGRTVQLARSRALTRLAQEFPDRFGELLAEERSAA